MVSSFIRTNKSLALDLPVNNVSSYNNFLYFLEKKVIFFLNNISELFQISPQGVREVVHKNGLLTLQDMEHDLMIFFTFLIMLSCVK